MSYELHSKPVTAQNISTPTKEIPQPQCGEVKTRPI